MPQFHLDTGERDATIAFRNLDYFTQGYVDAMFFTDASDPDDGDLADATFEDLSPELLAKIIADCQRFQNEQAYRLSQAYCVLWYSEERAGHDFWLTRNGHGAGFWDRGLDFIGNELTDACKAFSQVDIYRGDDGRVYS